MEAVNLLKEREGRVTEVAYNSNEAKFAGECMTVIDMIRQLDQEGWVWKNYEKIKY